LFFPYNLFKNYEENSMTAIRQLCDNDPAVAIEYMIDGLVNHGEIANFELDFDSSIRWANGICTGGAATVTLIKVLNMSFAPPELNDEFTRAGLMQTDMRDLLDFEEAIELFRQGSLVAIERYFGLPATTTTCSWNLQNHNWETELLEIISFWEQLTGRRYKKSSKKIDERWVNAVAAVNQVKPRPTESQPDPRIRCSPVSVYSSYQ
jgi:hypothetical protein